MKLKVELLRVDLGSANRSAFGFAPRNSVGLTEDIVRGGFSNISDATAGLGVRVSKLGRRRAAGLG